MTTRYPGAGSTACRRFAPSIPSVSLPSEARTVASRTPLKKDLPDPPGGREDEGAAFGKKAGSCTAAELVVSDDLYPPQRTVLRVSC